MAVLRLTFILFAASFALMAFYIRGAAACLNDTDFMPGVSFFLVFVSFVLNMFALRAIKKDDMLVRSVRPDQMRVFLLAFIVLLASCAVKTDAVALRKEAEESRVALMRTESDVSGNFYRLRTFHLDTDAGGRTSTTCLIPLWIVCSMTCVIQRMLSSFVA